MIEGQGTAQPQELPQQESREQESRESEAHVQEPHVQEPQGQAGDTVELEYLPTVADYTSALKARRRVSRAGRIQRRFLIVLGFLVVMAVVSATISGEAPDFSSVWVVLCVLLIWFMPWLQARQVHRISQQRGTFRVTVTDAAGVSMATDNTTVTVDWAAQPRYHERPDLFVLLSADKNASCFTVLPKRALRTPEDVDRLRAILDRRTTRA
ncbi:YcxB family protein [Streptomyces sp. NPDC060188]|uniref:YcxB family protein n=1 Tax=Streptomyces sp. NPDC060188 TaxID=3347068 RepID=UPI003651208D